MRGFGPLGQASTRASAAMPRPSKLASLGPQAGGEPRVDGHAPAPVPDCLRRGGAIPELLPDELDLVAGGPKPACSCVGSLLDSRACGWKNLRSP